MKVRTAILLTLVISVVCLGPVSAAAAGDSALDFRVLPAPGSAVSDGGDYFVLDAEPNDTVTQRIEVTNPSSQTLQVKVAAVDAATAQMGGVDYSTEEGEAQATGSWITVEDDEVTLRPKATTRVSFDVAVPADAATGTHLAGLAVWVEKEEQAGVEGAPATMSIQTRRVIAVQIDLPGAASPLLQIRGAKAAARPDGLYLEMDLFNEGTGFGKATGTVTIEGRSGEGGFIVDTVVPATGTSYPFKWSDHEIPSGSYDVEIELDYGTGITSWQGQVTVGAAVQKNLESRGVGSSEGVDPLAILAGVVASVALVLFILGRIGGVRLLPSLRRRPRRLAPVPATAVARVRPQTPVHRRPTAAVASAPTTQSPRVPAPAQRRIPPPPPPPPARVAPPPPPPPGAGRAA